MLIFHLIQCLPLWLDGMRPLYWHQGEPSMPSSTRHATKVFVCSFYCLLYCEAPQWLIHTLMDMILPDLSGVKHFYYFYLRIDCSNTLDVAELFRSLCTRCEYKLSVDRGHYTEIIQNHQVIDQRNSPSNTFKAGCCWRVPGLLKYLCRSTM